VLSTGSKVRIARYLSTGVLFLRRTVGLAPIVTVGRRGITWSLDLREGIDLAIYLLGGFEVATLRRYEKLVRPGDVVLDIGANVGAHTLPFAKLVGPAGRVYAFEPTAYAFSKQRANIALNPELAPRIVSRQVMLTATADESLPQAVYSSWPLESAPDLHHDHRGRLMGTEGAATATLDAYMAAAGVNRVDFMKIDVDGHEMEVLKGAGTVLRTYKPLIMIELAPYVHQANPHEFDDLIEEITALGYRLQDMATGRMLSGHPSELRKFIPAMGGLNVLAAVPD
jgi:FkbM family methyltransferase